MKDRQVEQTPAQLRIPIVSAVLHCVAMTVIVFLRSGFGYAYLRPRSIFFAGTWAFILFTIYAWNEPAVWASNSALCWFGVATITLYWTHLIRAFLNELRGTATHDNDSGSPHFLRIVGIAHRQSQARLRMLWVIWAEPALVLVAALVFALTAGGKNLSAWLLLVAPCLWLKEALNYWTQLRQRKRQGDAMEDAQDGLNSGHVKQDVTLPTASRKDKVKRQRVR